MARELVSPIEDYTQRGLRCAVRLSAEQTGKVRGALSGKTVKHYELTLTCWHSVLALPLQQSGGLWMRRNGTGSTAQKLSSLATTFGMT